MSECTIIDNIKIRKAKKEDMVHVYNLIVELAKFEKLEDQVKLSPATLERDGFSKHPSFSCLVVEATNSLIIGYAIYYKCYSTWIGESIFLEDLYVQEKYRGSGIGKKLFLTVAKIAQETSGRMDFHVLSWNPAIDFYKKMGAADLSAIEDWKLFRMEGDNLKK